MTHTKRYFLELAFDGSRYHGWQIQNNALSIQEVVNKSLCLLLREPVATIACGRTDAGVHAHQLFVHFDTTSLSIDQHPTKALRSLNALLPVDIAAIRFITVSPNAHARFDAHLRSYEYHTHFRKDPFLQKYSWQLREVPDVSLMNRAADSMIKYTDFQCFSKSNRQVKTKLCHITKAVWVQKGASMIFYISADRFLRNMVRAIVGTLLLVGWRKMCPEAIRTIIESKNRSWAGMSVPACGLFLTAVSYPYINSESKDLVSQGQIV